MLLAVPTVITVGAITWMRPRARTSVLILSYRSFAEMNTLSTPGAPVSLVKLNIVPPDEYTCDEGEKIPMEEVKPFTVTAPVTVVAAG
jgi:hypothetical protein